MPTTLNKQTTISTHELSYHLLYKLLNSSIHPFPFSHLLIPDIFPQFIYTDLTDNLPPIDLYKPFVKTLNHTTKQHNPTRYEFILSLENINDCCQGNQKDILLQLYDLFCDGNFSSYFIQHYVAIFDLCNEQGWENKSISFSLSLIKDIDGYYIDPHTDINSKLFTLLFYLASDDKHQHLGTRLYSPKDSSANFTHDHYPLEKFHLVQTMPFLPNHCFCLFRSNNSFHGVSKLTESGYERNTLSVTFYME